MIRVVYELIGKANHRVEENEKGTKEEREDNGQRNRRKWITNGRRIRKGMDKEGTEEKRKQTFIHLFPQIKY